MDTYYRFTPIEAWALVVLLYLPVNAGSALAQWLTQAEEPALEEIITEAVSRLEAKGYLRPDRRDDPVPPDLLRALVVAALNKVHLTVAMRRNGKLAWTYFAQLEEDMVQYLQEDNGMVVHPAEGAFSLAASLVPDWFKVHHNEGFQARLPFGAFLLLVTACQLQDIYSALQGFDEATAFPRSDLVNAFMQAQDWVDIYHAMEIPGVPRLEDAPIKIYMQGLIDQGYLLPSGEDEFTIGANAQPFYEVFSDPDLCSLTLSMQLGGNDYPLTGALIYGNGRLLLTEFSDSGMITVKQLASTIAAIGWTNTLVTKGSQVQAELTPFEMPDPEVHKATVVELMPKFCTQCGAQMSPEKKFCTRCGTRLKT